MRPGVGDGGEQKRKEQSWQFPFFAQPCLRLNLNLFPKVGVGGRRRVAPDVRW